jgi:hypothetical protein
MVISMEQGMGRKFAREWYNTNRALMIAEHQRKTDAKRTKVDRYMEQMFHMADPALEDDEAGRQVQKALTELFMVKAGCLADDNDEEEYEEPAKEEQAERREAAPTTTTRTTVFTVPLLAAPSTVVDDDDKPQVESELDMALDFFHDMGGCMYMTTYKAASAVATRVS